MPFSPEKPLQGLVMDHQGHTHTGIDYNSCFSSGDEKAPPHRHADLPYGPIYAYECWV
jgi:hypothetical protein